MKLSLRLARGTWSVHTLLNKSLVLECRYPKKSVTRKAYAIQDLAGSKGAFRKISTENKKKHLLKLDLFIHHKTSINCIKGFKSCNKILRSYGSLDFVIILFNGCIIEAVCLSFCADVLYQGFMVRWHCKSNLQEIQRVFTYTGMVDTIIAIFLHYIG